MTLEGEPCEGRGGGHDAPPPAPDTLALAEEVPPPPLPPAEVLEEAVVELKCWLTCRPNAV